MDLRDTVMQQLDRYRQGGTLEVSLPEGKLTVRLHQVDSIGCTLDELLWETDRLVGADLERLRALAEFLASRLTYLNEPLRLVEMDGSLQAAQLRSWPPDRTRHGPQYYEVLVRSGGSISVRRWEQPRGATRQSIPAPLTRQALARLADDVVGALDQLPAQPEPVQEDWWA